MLTTWTHYFKNLRHRYYKVAQWTVVGVSVGITYYLYFIFYFQISVFWRLALYMKACVDQMTPKIPSFSSSVFLCSDIITQSWNGSFLENRLPKYLEKQRHYFANKGPSNQGYRFSSGHIWMRELDCEESWELKNWCFWTVVLEKTLESLLDCKEIQPVHSKGDQPWVFIGRTDVEAETSILWPPHVKSWLIGKDSDAGRD